MKKQKNLLYILIAMMISSCSATIESNKDPDFNYKFKKLYVIIKVGENTKSFSPKFSSTLKELLSQRGVEGNFKSLDPLSLESETDVINQINSSTSDGLVIITQTKSITTYDNLSLLRASENGTYDIKIFFTDKKNPVWRGNLKVNTNGYGSVPTMTAEKLFEKLVEDGLI